MGKLIVFEGTDGSGKTTQFALLTKRLKSLGIDFRTMDFPQYSEPSSSLIRMYLGGEFGSKPSDVNAYAASTFYAVDRFASYREDWGEIYENGGLILSDRYTTSNAVHQGSKLPAEELPEFFAWLYDLEYNKMGLPKPDMVIYLDVDVETSLSRMARRQQNTNTKADIHEQDVEYLQRCLMTARRAADYYGWVSIDYLKDGVERDVDEKNQEIFDIILRELGNK